MKHAEIRRELAARAAQLLQRPQLVTAIKPRDYQLLGIDAIRRQLDSDDQSHRAYITHATGLGKTALFASLIQFCTGLRTLVIVPTKVLVEQTACDIARFTGGVIGHISSLTKIHDSGGNVIAIRGHEFMDVVVTTVASFNNFSSELAKQFDPHLVIVDECHNTYTNRCQAALAKFSEAFILAFSATPDYLVVENRKDHIPVTMENGQTLYVHPNRMASTHYNREVDARHVVWGIEHGWLCQMAWGHIDFDINLDGVPLVQTDAGWDYNEGALYDAMADHWPTMIEVIVGVYKNNRPYILQHRQSYALCLRMKEAKDLSDALNDNKLGIKADYILNTTSDKERRRILTAYRNREIQFLSSVMTLREGWDSPAAEVAWMLRPTQSRVLYVQGMGRGLRLDPFNPDKIAFIIDPLFQGRRHAPLSAPKLFGAPGQEYISGDILVGKKFRGTRGQQSSPYLPRHVRPKLIVVDDVEGTPSKKYSTIELASAATKIQGIADAAEYNRGAYKKDPKLPASPRLQYGRDKWQEIGGWPGYIGTGKRYSLREHFYATIEEASDAACKLGLRTQTQYVAGYEQDPKLPSEPWSYYGHEAWERIGRAKGFFARRYGTIEEASKAAQELKLTSLSYRTEHKKDPRLPCSPHIVYKKDWERIGRWPGFLGRLKTPPTR